MNDGSLGARARQWRAGGFDEAQLGYGLFHDGAGSEGTVSEGHRAWLARNWAQGGWSQTFIIGLVVAVVLAASGGFETFHIPLIPRFAYWIGLITGGVFVARTIHGWADRAPWLWGRKWLAAATIAAGTTVPMSLVVTVSSAWISGVAVTSGRIWAIFPDVVAVTIGTTILATLADPGTGGRTRPAPEGAPPAKFLSRLPPKLAGADLFAVEAQDHYLRLHTSKGEDLILMRLSDAVGELQGLEGARTHRSWWVARGALAAVERVEGRAVLTLKNGLQAPVSRSYVRPLREAGWF
jgi:hypothetical protein